jgi:hypothetical protein
VEAWWSRLSEAEQAALRVELDLLRPVLAASLEGSPQDLAAAPLEPVPTSGVPLRHLGVVWVGVTPSDAMSVGTSQAVELVPSALPVLGLFPMAGPVFGSIGYALVLPAGFGAFGPRATLKVYSAAGVGGTGRL